MYILFQRKLNVEHDRIILKTVIITAMFVSWTKSMPCNSGNWFYTKCVVIQIVDPRIADRFLSSLALPVQTLICGKSGINRFTKNKIKTKVVLLKRISLIIATCELSRQN
jgi:hypothetical protein